MRLPIIREEQGTFYGEQLADRYEEPFLGKNDEELRAWVEEVFGDMVRAKAPETERLRTLSRYYDGWMYSSPALNRTRPITNYCHSTVETVVPQLTEARPRPEIVPRQSMRADAVKRLQSFASWLQSRSNFDIWNVMATRDASIYGWSSSFPSFDYRTGMPYPKNLSVFDFYKDGAASNMDDCEIMAIGTPVATRKVAAMYPEAAKLGKIKPDSIVSPAFEACEQPFFEHMQNPGSGFLPPTITAAVSRREGESTPTGTAWYVPTPDSLPWSATTFLIQILVRDDSEAMLTWVGHETRPHEDGDEMRVDGAHRQTNEPVCPHGWRMITMTYDGCILENCPVDPCFGGGPAGGVIKVLRRYPRTDRFWSGGDLDQGILVQRQILSRDWLLMRGLELQANPPLLTDLGSQLPADKGSVEGGEILRIARGSDAKWLEFRGPNEHQFELRLINARDMDTVTGVHDVAQGQRPAGIEAASAIRALQQGAGVRIRGYEPLAHLHRADMLKSLMTCAGKKLNRRIHFRAGGEETWVDPEDVQMEYDLDFAEGSGNAPNKEQIQETAFLLFDRGVLDPDGLMKALDWMGREEVMAKMALMQQTAPPASGGGNGNGKAGGRLAEAGRN